MSVQSLSLPSAAPEPLAARRRAPEQDDGREAATFTLPEETRPDRPAPAATAREPAEPRPADEAAPRREAKADEGKSDKATPDKTAADTTKAADKPKAPAKPAETATAVATPAAPVVPAPGGDLSKLDTAAIVAIAAAGQVVPGKAQGATEANGETSKEKKEGEPAVASEAKPVDPSVILPAAPVVIEAAPTAAGMAPAIAAGASDGQGEAAALAGIAAAAAGSTAVNPADTAPGQPGQVVQAASPQPKAPAPQTAAASTDIAAKTETGPDTDKPVASGEAAVSPVAKEAMLDRLGQAVAPASFADALKSAETAPQAQAPIDLSAIVPPRTGKVEGLPGLDALAQATAQQAPSLPGHGTSAGPATPLHVVPIEIGLRALAGSRSFDIRLDPAELGRIDVNLDISDKGEVNARLVVDRVETLHLLQRDSRTLERAFEQAGLKPSDAGVDIALRDPSDQSGFRQSRQDQEASRQARAGSDAGEADPVILAQPATVRRLVRLGGVDLSI
ncbi:flagellar hook-length control protein FliK [Bosea sp. PAMC 26642]|uniref:flagellar hook-length control protein FliK n=1 Tax=Bosea sp. (strain PAMC 26642) TaxID=1792307 RepID=UPI0007702584|nr:flagellar hook-length control protein FliK [Bosea sp. PAMC 26642]AMJ60923.1 hypothetical protein AXW83_12020 [Bosea sp. PAMC 26642]